MCELFFVTDGDKKFVLEGEVDLRLLTFHP